jgi:hypothetical protein
MRLWSFLKRVLRRRRVVNQRELDYDEKVRSKQQPKLLAAPEPDNTYNRLIGYIPADAIAIYLMGVGVFGGSTANVPGRDDILQVVPNATQLHWLWILFWSCLVLAPCLAAIGTLRPGPDWRHRVQLFQVLSAPFAFAAWAFAVGGPFVTLKDLWSPQAGALVLLLATAVITAADKLFDFLEKSRNQNNNQPNKPSPNDN